MLSISVTERRTFKSCRRKWLYQKVLGIVPTRERQRSFWIGSGVHAGLETYYKGLLRRKRAGDPVASFWRWIKKQEFPSDLTDQEHEELEADKLLAAGMLANYNDWASPQDNFKVLYIEHQIARDIPGFEGLARLTGKVDLVVADPKGRIGFLDHKTTSVEPDLAYLDLDDQMSAYAWLLQGQEEFEADGVSMAWHNFLRKKLPAIPQLLQRGGLSQNKGLDTTYEIYLAAIKEHKLRRADYKEMLDALKQRGNRFFYRVPIQRSAQEITFFPVFLTTELSDMVLTAAYPESRAYPNPDFFCGTCVYRTICKAALEVEDVSSYALETGRFDMEDTQFQRGAVVSGEHVFVPSGGTVRDTISVVLDEVRKRSP